MSYDPCGHPQPPPTDAEINGCPEIIVRACAVCAEPLVWHIDSWRGMTRDSAAMVNLSTPSFTTVRVPVAALKLAIQAAEHDLRYYPRWPEGTTARARQDTAAADLRAAVAVLKLRLPPESQ